MRNDDVHGGAGEEKGNEQKKMQNVEMADRKPRK
jgi:hypothetical protein